MAALADHKSPLAAAVANIIQQIKVTTCDKAEMVWGNIKIELGITYPVLASSLIISPHLYDSQSDKLQPKINFQAIVKKLI